MIAQKPPGPAGRSYRVHNVADGLWLLRYPLSVFGTEMGRTVTLIRLGSGQLVIHSTAPFTAADVKEINALGQPAWLVEATRLHDTFAAAARAAFPSLPYLVPDGSSLIGEGSSSARSHLNSLANPPPQWHGELDVMQLHGMPNLREHVFFHRSTRTLIVADLVFNFGAQATAWTRLFFRWAGGIRHFPGMSRLFHASIRDRAAFAHSIRAMMEWDFDRLIVGHGEIIESGAKPRLRAALATRGF